MHVHAPQDDPFVMLRPSKNLTGNRRFHGFCVDVLERISSEVGFDYLLDLVPDRKYGARDPVTGQWNGMVRELMQHVNTLPDFPCTFSRLAVLPVCVGPGRLKPLFPARSSRTLC